MSDAYTVRPLREDELEDALEVRNALFPRDPLSPDLYRQQLAEPTRRDFVVDDGGRVVALAYAQRDAWAPSAETAFASVGVLPANRRRGMGTVLATEVSRHAASLGAVALHVGVREDDAESLAFATSRGFAEVGRMQNVVLELEGCEPNEPQSSGFEIAPIGDQDEALYQAALEIERDVPSPSGQPMVVPAFDEWRRRLFTRAYPDRAHSVVAVADGVIVGYAIMECGADGVAWHAMTGVRRAWRGRGVAKALKLAQIASAKRAGLRELSALNSIHNAPMRAINEQLGYRPRPAMLQLRGPLVASGAGRG